MILHSFDPEVAGQLWASVVRNVGAIVLSPDGFIVDVNDLFGGMLGWRADELVGQSHDALCPPWVREAPQYAAFWAALRAGERQAGVFERQARNGSTVQLRAEYTPVDGDQVRLPCIVGIAREWTQERRREALHAWRRGDLRGDADLAPADAATAGGGPLAAPGAQFGQLPGIDVTAGLASCAGDAVLYRTMLLTFVASSEDFRARFGQDTRRDDWRAARWRAHTLKGSADAIGASALRAAAQSLETLCRAPDAARSMVLDDALAHVDSLLQRVREGLSGLSADAPEVSR